MRSPGLTSGLAPGGPNSLSATRPSDFRPTSTMAYSSVRRRTRPVTTEPSKPVSRPRVSSSRAEKFSPRKWSWVGAGAMARAVADAAIWRLCSVTDVRGLSRGLPWCARFAWKHVLPAEGTAGRVADQAGNARWASDIGTDTRHFPGVEPRNRDEGGRCSAAGTIKSATISAGCPYPVSAGNSPAPPPWPDMTRQPALTG